jgi:hypothetical protein
MVVATNIERTPQSHLIEMGSTLLHQVLIREAVSIGDYLILINFYSFVRHSSIYVGPSFLQHLSLDFSLSSLALIPLGSRYRELQALSSSARVIKGDPREAAKIF